METFSGKLFWSSITYFSKEIKPLILASIYKFWQSHMSYRDFCHFEVHFCTLSEKTQDNSSLYIIWFVSVQKMFYYEVLMNYLLQEKQGTYTFSVECINIVLVIVGMCANCWRHIKHSNIWHNRQLKANKIKWPIKERNRVKM